MFLYILLFLFGIVALIKGEFKITNGRKVRGGLGRLLGVLMLIGSFLPLLTEYGAIVAVGVLFFTIVIGLVTSESITVETPRLKKPKNKSQNSPMTPMQIGILSVLALVACIIFGIGGFLIYSLRSNTVAANQPASPVQVENTAVFTATPEPTATPTFTPTPIPGWNRFEGGGVELWLPASYEGGDSAENLEMIVAMIKSIGAGHEQIAQALEQDPGAMPFFALDRDNLGTTVNVTIREMPAEMSLEAYMEGYVQALQEQVFFEVRVTQQTIVTLDQYQAGQLLLEIGAVEAPNFQLTYVIKENGTVWTINYATLPEQIGQQLPIFQQSIQTFRVQTD